MEADLDKMQAQQAENACQQSIRDTLINMAQQKGQKQMA